MFRIVALFALSLRLFATASAEGIEHLPRWIWLNQQRTANEAACFRVQFDVDKQLIGADLLALADFCHSAIYVNGERLAESEPYARAVEQDIAPLLHKGNNTIGVCCRSVEGPAALMARLDLRFADGTQQTLVSGPQWQAALHEDGASLAWPNNDPNNAKNRNENTIAWRAPPDLGKVLTRRFGLERESIAINPADDYTQWKRAIEARSGTDPKTFQVARGFEVELLHSARDEEGSWICLTSDPLGRWLIGTEEHGVLRLTLPESAQVSVDVERISDLRECRGLEYLGDKLYAMANGDTALYRLRDTTGDDAFDDVQKLHEFRGDKGHGRNQLTVGPDGNLWGIFGDSVFLPDDADVLPPKLAQPIDAEKERSGFVVRFGGDARNMQVVVRGLRNPYGLDFNRWGDMFTYDADAEYDMGSSWYRPTRVNHLLPGGDYGWRRVTRQWPPYFPDRADMPRPTLDIGKGSPTAVEFCSGEQFPARYRDALFALDWAYGRILAVHITPRGSSYYASPETFLRGQPLNVTDVEFGTDGAMYFVTGGRKTQSALYRVKYVGEHTESEKPSLQQQARLAHAETSSELRRRITSINSNAGEPPLDFLWQYLGSADPWIRHAARTALERHPPEAWRARAMEATDIATSSAARMALLRVDPAASTVPIAKRLAEASFSEYAASLQLEMLFQYDRCLFGGVELPSALRNELFDTLAAHYPAEDTAVNIHLSHLLSHQPDRNFVRKTMRLLHGTDRQAARLHYLFVLREVQSGWTPEPRSGYFQYLRQMDDYVGGEGLPTFRKLIREAAVDALPKDDRSQFAALLKSQTPPWERYATEARTEFIRKWTVDELAAAWQSSDHTPDLKRGREMFIAARCIACHRCGGPGGFSGPDLTSVSRRFTPRDMLTSIIEPSKVISEKYASTTFQLESGKVVTGRVATGDYRLPHLEVMPDLLEPHKTLRIDKSNIARRKTARVSPMPSGLLDTLEQEEIFDLLGFLMLGDQRAER